MVRRTTLCLALSLATIFAVAGPAHAVALTLFVNGGSSACNDSGAGTLSEPFCTISKAASTATAGQTVQISSGTYAESVTVANSGSSGAPIVFTSVPGATVIVTGGSHGFTISSKSYITISNLRIADTTSYGLYITGSNHITITGNRVSGSGSPVSGSTAMGMYISGTTDSLISKNISDHNSEAGIYVVSSSTRVTVSGNQTFNNAREYTRAAPGIDIRSAGNSVIGNISHDNEDSGIQVYTGGDSTLVANNVVYNNGDHGIDDLNVTGGRVVGNTVFRNCTSGINVEGTSGSYLVENNIAVDNAVYPAYNGIACARRAGNIGVFDSAVSSTTADYNLVFLSTSGTMYSWGSSYTSLTSMRSATGQEAHGVQADPKFVAAGSWDLHVQSGSPAIDSADSGASGQQAMDLEGNSRIDDPATSNTGAGTRTYDDRGAYEFQPSGSDSPPVAALSVSPSSGIAPLTVTADASASTDTDATPISTYAFNFGDGSAVVGPQAGATAQHTYTTTGSFTVTVTVKDTANLSSTATKTVSVGTDQPPAASLSVSPTSGNMPLAVTANASASTDNDGTPISTYTFDFGDGSAAVGPQAGATAQHTYTTAGSFTVTVTVTDTANKSSQATASVSVADTRPSASLQMTPTSGTAPLDVSADSSGSTDPDATPISTYTFDFGDGSAVVGPQAGATAAHQYTQPGVYTATVTVTDTANFSSQATATVTVSSTNLVSNDGFESGTSGWGSGESYATLSRVAGGHSGSWAAQMSWSGKGRKSCTLNDSPNVVATTLARRYTGSLWVRGDSGNVGTTFTLRFREYSGTTLVGTATATVNLTTSWQQVTVSYLARAGNTLDFNGYTAQKAGTCFYADDASITYA